MKHSSLTRFGFTLVEMLTVIAIIGILAALMSGAMVAVRARVQKAAISSEIHQLEMALEVFKSTYGDYPPDGTDSTAVKRFLAKAFPRASIQSVDGLTPKTALYIWLGGYISKNPKNPFDGNRSDPLFEFKKVRLNEKEYKSYSKDDEDPFIYFRGSVAKDGTISYSNSTACGNIKPYQCIDANNKTVYCGEKPYQIVSPGLDGKLGSKGGNISTDGFFNNNAEALDNQASFGNFDDLAD